MPLFLLRKTPRPNAAPSSYATAEITKLVTVLEILDEEHVRMM
jgi:hypothetical protein